MKHHTVYIPGDYEDTEWVVTGRVIDPHNKWDALELEVIEVRFVLQGAWSTPPIPISVFPADMLYDFTTELNGDYQNVDAEIEIGAVERREDLNS